MYYIKHKTISLEGFDQERVRPSTELIALYREYHGNNKLLKDARVKTDDNNATDVSFYESKTVMDEMNTKVKEFLDAGKTWGSGITFEKIEEGEVGDYSEITGFDLSKKSFNF